MRSKMCIKANFQSAEVSHAGASLDNKGCSAVTIFSIHHFN